MFDFLKISEKIKAAKEEMASLQDKLKASSFSGEAGGGLVRVEVNGAKELMGLHIDSSLVNPNEAQVLRDLIIAAVNLAIKQADAETKAAMREKAKDFLPNIPGLDISQFL